MEERKNEKSSIDYLVKSLAILGLVFVLFLGGIGVVKVAGSVPDFFSSIASVVVNITSRFLPAEKIVVSADPQSVVSGGNFLLSFEHESKTEEGSYAFFYKCSEGVHFERTGQVVFCNTPYSLLGESEALNLRAFSVAKESVFLPLEIRFTENNSDEVSLVGDIDIGISNNNLADGGNGGSGNTGGNVARTPGTRTESTEVFNQGTTGGGGVSNPLGQPDLEARILEVGVVDRQTNQFTATSSIASTARGAVKFEIENVGNKTSSNWFFNAVLPTFPRHIYHSPSQVPLAPGDRIEFILGFDSVQQDGEEAVFVVNADPSNILFESNEQNNIARRTINIFKN